MTFRLRRMTMVHHALAGAISFLLVPALAAQGCEWFPCPPEPPPENNRFTGHLVAAGLNAILGGLVSGGIASVNEKAAGRAILGGIAGGAIGYGGRVVAAEPWTGAGVLGRQIGAVGASVVANSSAGDPPLERLALPLGPVFFHMHIRESPRVDVRVDVPALLHVTYAAFDPSMSLEWGSTLASGVPVLSDRRNRKGHGSYLFSAVVLHRPPGSTLTDTETSRVLRHERVHALQHDFSSIVLGDRLDGRIVPVTSRIGKHVHLRLDFFIGGTAALLLPPDAQPWEREAYFLTP